MTREIDFHALAAPFPAADITWRVQACGMGNKGPWARVLAYVTARAIQGRLDHVCGPANWCNTFDKAPDGGVLCGLSLNVGGSWVTKWDGAERTQVEAVKGGLSGAMKRAAVQWGIGRYLYRLPTGWAVIIPEGQYFQPASHKGGTPAFSWNPPALPAWALP